jgi:predicted RNA-binding Zn ribbon-like protein
VKTDEVGSSAAPGRLELVRRFVNTLDIETGDDALATPVTASTWLGNAGWTARVDVRQLDELVTFREALRDVVSARGTSDEPGAFAALDTIAGRHPLAVRLASPETLTPSSRGVDGFIERILGLVAAARIGGSWDRVKTCANDRCRWCFYDRSRNRSRTWCTMDLCGSQAKMRAYRSRRHATHAGPGDRPGPGFRTSVAACRSITSPRRSREP